MSTEQEDIRDLVDGPIFDYQTDGPQMMSEHLEDVLQEALDAGIHGATIYYDVLRTARARQFRDDPDFRQQIKEWYDEAGITIHCPTLVSVKYDDPLGRQAVLEDLRRWGMYIDSADWMSRATDPEDLTSDGVSVLFAAQNSTFLNGNIDNLETLYDWGVRSVQLTYNTRNNAGDGCYERSDAGLSNFGVNLVDGLNDLGMIVDLSHCGHSTKMDAIERSAAPPAFTHTAAKALHNHPRGATDEELEAIAEADGYVGVVTLTRFLGGSRDLAAMMDHIDHIVDIVGVDRVGIGTDWGGGAPEVPDALYEDISNMFRSRLGASYQEADGDESPGSYGRGLPPMKAFTDWIEIPKALYDRGYSEEEVAGICGSNFVEYFTRVAN